MNILLINTNPVVSRLISLCTHNDKSIVFEEIMDVTEASENTYDIIFVDHASYDDQVVFLDQIANIGKLVFLSSYDTDEEVAKKFDIVVKKPFLPSQIQAIVDQVKTETPLTEEELALLEVEDLNEIISENTPDIDILQEVPKEKHITSPLKDTDSNIRNETKEEDVIKAEEQEESSDMPKVLDGNDIEQIKILLDENDDSMPSINLDDSNIRNETKEEDVIKAEEQEESSDMPKVLDGNDIEQIKTLLDENDDSMSSINLDDSLEIETCKAEAIIPQKLKEKEEVSALEEALLVAIEEMKPKKIKKLLEGAEISIKIRFKDNI
ncbi:MAG: hypothetical protein LGB68_03175 [Sulfurovum sp.]|nr:hypothetical protein [Sulfurovum sp.]MCB4757931.1 hypothetical protein [Sulfurovum sp.]MCB4762882.1 hypothetical protein [Sulfurovum sp.]MCB4765267.1 hypothetical protein [Sulfurovum sp.]MCB4774350.1 hypothetical protein [Sulfurovum sp.]